jgi:hypothetical protein
MNDIPVLPGAPDQPQGQIPNLGADLRALGETGG